MNIIQAKIIKIQINPKAKKESEKRWFVNCNAYQNGDNVIQYNNILLIHNNQLPKIGDVVLLFSSIYEKQSFCFPILDLKNLIQSGDSFLGDLKNNNKLLIRDGKIELKMNNVNIQDNISKEREEDIKRQNALKTVLTALMSIPELASINAIITTAIETINESIANSTTLKTNFDKTYF
jgi:hypothetical protein